MKLGIPCSKIKEFIKDAEIQCTCETEAMAIAAGMILAGGKPEVYMQNSGLFTIADIVLSLYKPYDIKLPPLLLSLRRKPYHHSFVGSVTYEMLGLLEYDDVKVIDQHE